jgi:hypothetical protein
MYAGRVYHQAVSVPISLHRERHSRSLINCSGSASLMVRLAGLAMGDAASVRGAVSGRNSAARGGTPTTRVFTGFFEVTPETKPGRGHGRRHGNPSFANPWRPPSSTSPTSNARRFFGSSKTRCRSRAGRCCLRLRRFAGSRRSSKVMTSGSWRRVDAALSESVNSAPVSIKLSGSRHSRCR